VRPPVRQGVRVGLSAGLFVLVAAAVAACGSSTAPSPERTADESPTASAPAASATSPVSPSASPSRPPSASAAPPSQSAPATPASACAGNDDNRDFFASFAEAVEWDAYCPTLPDGWFVENGTYRLSGGAWMEIVYRGPGGARFGLQEGAFCHEGGDCVPDGTDVGAAAFGDREGTLVAADDGSWAVTVDRGLSPSWLATGSGLDEAAFRAHAEALALVGG
jgi:hypothetical protein